MSFVLAPVVAHRGASGEAPENTLAAILRAADDGAQAVEIDVNASADGVCYVHHDDLLDRCTSATGSLHEQQSADLDRVFAGAGMPGFDAEPLPRLDAIVDAVTARGLALNLEIKPPPGREAVTAIAICDALERTWPSDGRLIFSSFSQTALEVARERLPSLPRASLVGAIPVAWHEALARTGSVNVHCSADGFDRSLAARLADAGHRVYCYTVNDVEQAQRLLDAGAAGVFTDYPRRLLTGLRPTSVAAHLPA